RLISDISDASRLDAELSRAETEPVRLGPLLEGLVEVYRSTGEAGGLSITLDLPPGDPLEVPGLEGRLVQVFRNLLANAISFSPPDGTIHVAARRGSDDTVTVAIEDDGPGIPENKLEAIFERFYSERPRGEKFGTHSGLGLSISKQIVDAHGGAIRAENRPGPDGEPAGARFLVVLPMVGRASTKRAPTTCRDSRSARRRPRAEGIRGWWKRNSAGCRLFRQAGPPRPCADGPGNSRRRPRGTPAASRRVRK
ncbi:MAG: hypothetical protein HQL39_19565, partial [Alphaproteobacteria bacterium]|nr:hypothetical protein [Alphaproteobacteria bacterium]